MIFLPKSSYNHYLCLKTKMNLKDTAKLKNYLIVHMHLVKKGSSVETYNVTFESC